MGFYPQTIITDVEIGQIDLFCTMYIEEWIPLNTQQG